MKIITLTTVWAEQDQVDTSVHWTRHQALDSLRSATFQNQGWEPGDAEYRDEDYFAELAESELLAAFEGLSGDPLVNITEHDVEAPKCERCADDLDADQAREDGRDGLCIGCAYLVDHETEAGERGRDGERYDGLDTYDVVTNIGPKRVHAKSVEDAARRSGSVPVFSVALAKD